MILTVYNITSDLQRVLHFDELSSQIAGGTGSSRRGRVAPTAPGRGGRERGGGEHVDLAPQELQLLFLLLYHLLQLRRFLQEKKLLKIGSQYTRSGVCNDVVTVIAAQFVKVAWHRHIRTCMHRVWSLTEYGACSTGLGQYHLLSQCFNPKLCEHVLPNALSSCYIFLFTTHIYY